MAKAWKTKPSPGRASSSILCLDLTFLVSASRYSCYQILARIEFAVRMKQCECRRTCIDQERSERWIRWWG
jgi:hypothetical protein